MLTKSFCKAKFDNATRTFGIESLGSNRTVLLTGLSRIPVDSDITVGNLPTIVTYGNDRRLIVLQTLAGSVIKTHRDSRPVWSSRVVCDSSSATSRRAWAPRPVCDSRASPWSGDRRAILDMQNKSLSSLRIAGLPLAVAANFVFGYFSWPSLSMWLTSRLTSTYCVQYYWISRVLLERTSDAIDLATILSSGCRDARNLPAGSMP